jgi:hypothetical protein
MFSHRSQRAAVKKQRPKTIKHQARVKPESVSMSTLLRVLLAPRDRSLPPGLERQVLLLQISRPHILACSKTILEKAHSDTEMTDSDTEMTDELKAALLLLIPNRVYQIFKSLRVNRSHVAVVKKHQFATIQHHSKPNPLPETPMKPVREKLRSTTI